MSDGPTWLWCCRLGGESFSRSAVLDVLTFLAASAVLPVTILRFGLH